MDLTAAATVTPHAETSILSSLFNNVHFVGGAWMVSSAIFTTYSTTQFLKHNSNNNNGGLAGEIIRNEQHAKKLCFPLPRPTLLTLYRFSGSLLLGIMAHPDLHIIDRIMETWNLIPSFAFPACFLFLANYSNSISLDKIGISLTYTSKCAIPLITVLLTLFLDGAEALPSIPVLSMLIPIAVGIAAASWDHPHFEVLGFAAAMVSCTAQSALNVSCKRQMTKLGVAGAVAQRSMVSVGLVISAMFSIWQMASVPRTTNESKAMSKVDRHPPFGISLMATIAYHVEYALSFTFVKLVAPITYGASDAVRRLMIIISGHYMFGGHPFTALNLLGIAMALAGALGYSILNHT